MSHRYRDKEGERHDMRTGFRIVPRREREAEERLAKKVAAHKARMAEVAKRPAARVPERRVGLLRRLWRWLLRRKK